MEDQIIEFIRNLTEKNMEITYLVFSLSSLLQIAFPPYPGDSIIIFSGYVTTISSSLSLGSVILITLCGSMLGALIIYGIGYKNGEKVVSYKYVERVLSGKIINKARILFDKYDARAIFISKFIPGINTVIILLSGIFKIKPSVFCASFFFAALVHNTILIMLGKFLGNNMQQIKALLKTYNIIIIALIIIIVSVVYIYYRFSKVNTDNKN